MSLLDPLSFKFDARGGWKADTVRSTRYVLENSLQHAVGGGADRGVAGQPMKGHVT